MVTWVVLLREGRTRSEPWMIIAGEIGVGCLVETVIKCKNDPRIVRTTSRTPPHQGTIATIAEGGSMAKMSLTTQKRYSRSVLVVQERPTKRHDP
ncbi:hypothetical protein CR513_41964, partial [Mucuna pruriens]